MVVDKWFKTLFHELYSGLKVHHGCGQVVQNIVSNISHVTFLTYDLIAVQLRASSRVCYQITNLYYLTFTIFHRDIAFPPQYLSPRGPYTRAED